MREIKETFLDQGWDRLVDYMGDDYRILQSARVSTGGVASKGDKEDRGLIRYLYKNFHQTPFEQVVFTFHCKIPNFVATHLLRHRTFSFNMISQRYSQVDEEYYVPKEWRKQGITNHQGSGKSFSEKDNYDLNFSYKSDMTDTFSIYEEFVDKDVAKEMARMFLPSSVYTELYFTVNLRNLLHFLELRLHDHAQYETREFAKGISRILHEQTDLVWTMEIFDEMTSLNYKLQEKLGENISIERMIAALDLLSNG